MPGHAQDRRAASRLALLKDERTVAKAMSRSTDRAFQALKRWEIAQYNLNAAREWAASLGYPEACLEWHDAREIELEWSGDTNVNPSRYWARFGESQAKQSFGWAQRAPSQSRFVTIDMAYSPLLVVMEDNVVLHMPIP